jgi:hypothetical protein
MMDICELLVRWGAKKFIFISEQEGNLEAISQVVLLHMPQTPR